MVKPRQGLFEGLIAVSLSRAENLSTLYLFEQHQVKDADFSVLSKSEASRKSCVYFSCDPPAVMIYCFSHQI